MEFSAQIKIFNGNPYILISQTRASALRPGWKRPMPVFVTVNGQPKPPWRTNMMPIGDGRFYLYLHGDVRKASRTKVGDRVKINVRFDPTYKNGPMHPMPSWFGKALNTNSTAKNAWDKLTPSRQKEILRYFSWLKSDEARKRNLERVIHMLSGKPGRFMARSWKNGN